MNAEKQKQIIADVFKAIGNGDPEPLLHMLHDDITWTIIGDTWRFNLKCVKIP